ncbi:MAG: ATP-binding cassette domain-containing protein [Magnetococcus sp. DMHC-6]
MTCLFDLINKVVTQKVSVHSPKILESGYNPVALRINITSGAFLTSLLEKERGPIAKLLLDSRRVFVFAIFLTAVTEILSIAPILFMVNLFDRVISSRSVVTLISLTVLLFAVYAFDNSLEWVRRRLMTRFAMRLDWDIAIDVFDASFRRFAGLKPVNVQQIMGDVVELRNFFQGRLLIGVMEAPFAIVFAVIASFFHIWLSYFAFGALTTLMLLSYFKQRAATPLMRRANQSAAETNQMVAESLRHSETALALGMMGTIRNKWYKAHQDDLLLQAHGTEVGGLIGGAASVLTRSMPQLSMALMVYLSIMNEVTGGMAIGGMFLISKTMRPIQTMMNEWHKIIQVKLALERLERLLGQDEVWQDKMPLPAATGELEVVKLIAMPANKNRTLLTGIHFTLQPGTVLAIIGPSASGKTTLAKHLVGIMRPTSGVVRLDGADIADWIRAEHVPHLGYVPQDVMVLEGSVAENIARMGTVNSQEVVRAAQLVGLHRTILSFPNGYETQIGPGGYVLTGGQKQRLLIARALYGNPKLVVMDEPSSSLDMAAEQALIETIKTLRNQNTTVVLTTHRPNLVAISDYLLVLENGYQTAFGPTKELGENAARLANQKALSQTPASSTTPSKTTTALSPEPPPVTPVLLKKTAVPEAKRRLNATGKPKKAPTHSSIPSTEKKAIKVESKITAEEAS